MQVSVSFLKRKDNLKETLKKIEQTNCDYIHVDVMDGLFVVEKTENLCPYLQNISKKLDVHLMCAHPLDYINEYKNLPTEYITIQAEITDNLNDLINIIKKENIKVGLAINPDTPVSKIEPYFANIDQVLVMSVIPGKGGQEFKETAILKVKELDKLRKENNYHFIINVDGGINDHTITLLKNTGLDMCVSGSFICLSENFQKQINKLR